MHKYILLLHVLAATIWTGGHLVLAITILPKALRKASPETILEFEAGYEKIGMPALIIQVLTGFWLAYNLVPDVGSWFSGNNMVTKLILLKLGLLLTTAALALHARLRVIPNLNVSNLRVLGYHIIAVTVLSVVFVIVGVSFRTGGFF